MDFVEIINFALLANKLLFFLTGAVGLELILWSWAANRRTWSGRVFMAGAFFVLLWAGLDFAAALGGDIFLDAKNVSLWSYRGMYALLALFFGGFCLFALDFPAANPLDVRRGFLKKAVAAAAGFFCAISFSGLVVKETASDPVFPAASWIAAGNLFWLYAAAALAAQWFGFSELSRNRRLADRGNREKARWVALGAGIFLFFNFLFNVAGPAFGPLWGYVGFFALFADYALAVLLGYLFYSAARENLSGIKIILMEAFVGLMGASLLVMPVFVGVLWQKVLFMTLFLIFCVFGTILVKNSVKEYQEKELLEQKVAQRTGELEAAKRNLEEMNSILEIKVGARTRELEQLNRTLEEKVVERTNDLEGKVKDLEKFQKITVGRELKMIELKKEIKNLRAALGRDQSDKIIA